MPKIQYGEPRQEAEWRRTLEAAGEDVIRGRFANRMPVTDDGAANPPIGFTAEWLAEKARTRQRRENIRFWLMLFFTVVAAFGAIIAAWPVVFPLK